MHRVEYPEAYYGSSDILVPVWQARAIASAGIFVEFKGDLYRADTREDILRSGLFDAMFDAVPSVAVLISWSLMFEDANDATIFRIAHPVQA